MATKDKKLYNTEIYIKKLKEAKGTYEERKNFLQEFSLKPQSKSKNGETNNAETETESSSGSYLVKGQYGKFYSSNKYLSMEEMKVNAKYIFKVLTEKGWTPQAIAGMLGNIQTESTINPGLWQSMRENDMHMGFGLVQWTPASKFINWAKKEGMDYKSMDANLSRILWEVENKAQWISKSMSFREFTKSKDTPYNLAMVFIKAYERPKDPTQPKRGTQANFWYEYLTGSASKSTSKSSSRSAFARSMSVKAEEPKMTAIDTPVVTEQKTTKEYSYQVPIGKMKGSNFTAPKYIREKYVTDRKQTKMFLDKVGYAPLPQSEFIHLGGAQENYYSKEARELFMNLKVRLGYRQLVISRGFEPEPGDYTSHSVGIAMDVYAGTPEEAIRIADTAWLLGIRSISIGPKFVHIDAGPESVWGYDNLAVYRGPGTVKVGGLISGYR
ncbi:phage tail tip lysozyme [Gottfriedia acidiceleris]|uniref:phage tail tip lysozyme n=1 Tax=Gottfriedia acidiceleris TaxID=371036 RepID=UPI00339B4C8A